MFTEHNTGLLVKRKASLKRSTDWFHLGISYIFTIYLAATLFMPMFVKLEVTSAYEVKEKIHQY